MPLVQLAWNQNYSQYGALLIKYMYKRPLDNHICWNLFIHKNENDETFDSKLMSTNIKLVTCFILIQAYKLLCRGKNAKRFTP